MLDINGYVLYNNLLSEYSDAECELLYRTPLELSVGVILSAQAKDENVNKILPILFKRYHTYESFIESSPDEIYTYIKSIGLAKSKSNYIYNFCNSIYYKYNGIIPNNRLKLIEIKGIGIKTASVILNVLYSTNYIPIDTHVKRITERLGIYSEINNYKIIEKKLISYFDKCNLSKLAYMFISHGRRVCKSYKPLCNQCIFKYVCNYKKNI